MKNRHLFIFLFSLLATFGLAACGSPAASAPATAAVQVPSATAVPIVSAPTAGRSPAASAVAQVPSTVPSAVPTLAPTLVGTPTPDTRPDPKYWSSWPVIPTLSAAAQAIYQHGIALGNDPHVFSSIGDCQSAPNVFMGIFESDKSPLGPDTPNLLQTVQYYAGSFSRHSLSVHDGMSPPAALTTFYSDHSVCQSNENPVACELRVRKPSIMFINLGTVWKPGASAAPYEAYLRKIVDLLIAHGTLPILSTKADNVEGDHSLDLATARVAHDYDIPLWNFWLASNGMPNHGLDPARDNIYLTAQAWGPRSYSALQVLDKFWRTLNPAAAATVAAASPTATVEGAPSTTAEVASTVENPTAPAAVSTTAP